MHWLVAAHLMSIPCYARTAYTVLAQSLSHGWLQVQCHSNAGGVPLCGPHAGGAATLEGPAHGRTFPPSPSCTPCVHPLHPSTCPGYPILTLQPAVGCFVCIVPDRAQPKSGASKAWQQQCCWVHLLDTSCVCKCQIEYRMQKSPQ